MLTIPFPTFPSCVLCISLAFMTEHHIYCLVFYKQPLTPNCLRAECQDVLALRHWDRHPAADSSVWKQLFLGARRLAPRLSSEIGRNSLRQSSNARGWTATSKAEENAA